MKIHSLCFLFAAAVAVAAGDAGSLRGSRDQDPEVDNVAAAAAAATSFGNDTAIYEENTNEDTQDNNLQQDQDNKEVNLFGMDEQDTDQVNLFNMGARQLGGVTDARQLGGVTTENGDTWEMDSSAGPGDYGWIERKANGWESFKWKEISRDGNSVYLKDNNGRPGTTAKVDFYFGKIVYCKQKNNCVDLRTISSVYKIGQFGVDARRLGHVILANGNKWVYHGNKVWTENFANGQAPFYWKETGVDVLSVYLDDNNGRHGTTAQINLHEAVIWYCPQTGNCFNLQTITSAKWRM